MGLCALLSGVYFHSFTALLVGAFALSSVWVHLLSSESQIFFEVVQLVSISFLSKDIRTFGSIF